jgi:outer membrane protein
LDEAQARFDQTVAQEIEAKNTLEVKQRTLQRSVGKRVVKLKSLGEMTMLAPKPSRLEDWIEAGSKQDPQIELKRATVEYLAAEVEKSRAGHSPTLDFVASTSHAHNPSYFLNGLQDSTTFALQFNMPLYQGGYVSSKVRETLASKDKSEHDLEDALRTNELQTSDSFLSVTNGIAKVGALEQAVKSNESALHSTKMGREVGLRTSVDVLNAQQQLFSTKRDLSTARYDYIISRLKLKSAVGSLGMEDLESVDHWLKD